MATVSVSITTVTKSLPVGSTPFDHYHYYLQWDGHNFVSDVETTDTHASFNDVPDALGYFIEVQSIAADGTQLDSVRTNMFDIGEGAASPGTFQAANIITVVVS